MHMNCLVVLGDRILARRRGQAGDVLGVSEDQAAGWGGLVLHHPGGQRGSRTTEFIAERTSWYGDRITQSFDDGACLITESPGSSAAEPSGSASFQLKVRRLRLSWARRCGCGPLSPMRPAA